MEVLIEEGKMVPEDGDPAVIDAALIAAAQRVEQYEISAYRTARSIASHLKFHEVVALLGQTLEEESEAYEKLMVLSLEEILPASPLSYESAKNQEDVYRFDW